MKKFQYFVGVVTLAWIVYVLYDNNKANISACADNHKKTVSYNMSRMGKQACGTIELGEDIAMKEGNTIFYAKSTGNIVEGSVELSIFCVRRGETVAKKVITFKDQQLTIA